MPSEREDWRAILLHWTGYRPAAAGGLRYTKELE